MHPPGLLDESCNLTVNHITGQVPCTCMEHQYKTLILTLSHIPGDAYSNESPSIKFMMGQREIDSVTQIIERRMEATANPSSAKQCPSYHVSQKQRFSGMKPCVEQLNKNFMSSYYVEQCASIRAQDYREFLRYMSKQLSGKQDKVHRRIRRLLEIERGQVLLGEFIEEASRFPFVANEALIVNLKSILQPDSFAFPLFLQISETIQNKLCAQILEFMRSFFFQTMDLSWLLNLEESIFIRVILSEFNKIAAEMIVLSVQKSAPETLMIHGRLMEVLKSLSPEQCISYHTQKFLLLLLKSLSVESSVEARKCTKAIASFWLDQPHDIRMSHRYLESIDLDEIVREVCSL
ncbi:Hypothetical protein GLP15_4113 [Giardia lamblia P15]|uniref:Uncharacterized protein n=1 Tax=Giardia intestinalis (strain P15) TaxID=658858 RepID=E1F6B1_GIAIA|nr:Hypothetical protein GLP15_4113 [Giardia lamblia P15]